MKVLKLKVIICYYEIVWFRKYICSIKAKSG